MKRKNIPSLYMLLVLTISGLTSGSLFMTSSTFASAAEPTPLNFTELAIHPQAAAEPQIWQRQITELTVFNGKLLAGYGDYSSNTGPVDINPFDLETASFEGRSVTFPSESIGNWKVINGKLYTTNIDARSCANCATGYAVSTDGSNWEVKTPVTGLHIYDIETLTGTDLWLFGSSGGGDGVATVWRSLDDGETWNQVITPASGVRYYWGVAMGGKMYLQAFDGDRNDPVQIYDGSDWSTGTVEPFCYAGDYNGGPNPVVFNDEAVCYWTDHLRTFDGAEVAEVEVPAITKILTTPETRLFNGVAGDTKVTSDGYYMIDFSQQYDIEKPEQILRSPDLVRWQSLRGLPSKTTAMAIDEENSKIYVGTYDAKLYVADLPDMPDDLPFPDDEEPAEEPDLNNDGTSDSEQPNVSSISNPTTGKTIALELSTGCDIESLEVADEDQLEAQDNQFQYDNSLIDFVADCAEAGVTTNVKVFYYNVSEVGASARKYDPRTATYTLIDDANVTTQTIRSQPVTTVSYQVTDGQSLDVDGAENGRIVDPVGLAATASSSAGPSGDSELASTGYGQTALLAGSLVITTVAFREFRRQTISRR